MRNRQLKTVTQDLSNLLDRRKELLRDEPETTVRALIEQGLSPAEAAQQVQTASATKIQNEIELEAIEDRLTEVVEELAAELSNRKRKLEADAESKLHNSLLRWMSGTGHKLFEDEAIRERCWIHSAEAKPALAAAQKAAQVPVVRNANENYKWLNNRVQLPPRRYLANNTAHVTPLIEQDELGFNYDGLERLAELLERKN